MAQQKYVWYASQNCMIREYCMHTKERVIWNFTNAQQERIREIAVTDHGTILLYGQLLCERCIYNGNTIMYALFGSQRCIKCSMPLSSLHSMVILRSTNKLLSDEQIHTIQNQCVPTVLHRFHGIEDSVINFTTKSEHLDDALIIGINKLHQVIRDK